MAHHPGVAPTLLALVRHGESTWVAEGRFQGRGDPPLSDRGRSQARAVAARLAAPDVPPTLPLPPHAPRAIYHSPLRRAAQTAAAVAEAVAEARGADARLIVVDELTELSQGRWEGLAHAEVRARFGAELAAWRRDPLRHQAPDGESLAQAAARARIAAERILDATATSSAGAVAVARAGEPPEPVLGYERRYGDPERSVRTEWAIVVAHDGILRLLMLQLLGIDIGRYWSYPFALASVTVLDIAGGLVRLRAHNLDEHLTVT